MLLEEKYTNETTTTIMKKKNIEHLNPLRDLN